MDDKGGLSLTPSSALHREVAQRVLKIWEQMQKGEAGVEDLRAAVVDLKSHGAVCIGEDGIDLLGPPLAESPALRRELDAADRAYDLARDAIAQCKIGPSAHPAIDGLMRREPSNPYAAGALQQVVAREPSLKEQVAASKARRADSASVDDVLLPAEPDHRRLGASQLRAAIVAKARVQEERENLAKSLSNLYVAPKAAQAEIEAKVLSREVDAATLGRDISATPERFGEVRSFKAGFWKGEDRDARHSAVAVAARAGRGLAGIVGYFIGEINNSELEIAEQQSASIPALSKELNEALEQTPPGADLFAGISQENRRDRLVSEAQTLVRQISQRNLSSAGLGLAPQLASRLQEVQARLKSAVTLDRSRAQELEQRQESQTLSH